MTFRPRTARRHRLALASAWAVLAVAAGGQIAVAQDGEALAASFQSPPEQARPRVWWHWVNGNVSQEGIVADLAWMDRVGIGGFTLFDAAFRSPPTPVVVEKPLIFHSPEWTEAVRLTAAEAARLGLDFGVHIAGGWSESGGPWVQPQQAMKKLVWSETIVEGGRPFDGQLVAPPDASGAFQDLPIAQDLREPRLYRDVAIVAFPAPAEDKPTARLEANGGAPDLSLLTDGSYTAETVLTAEAGQAPRLTLTYDRPWIVRSLTLATGSAIPPGVVEASVDGVTFHTVLTLPGPSEKALPVRTYALPDVAAKVLRVTFAPADRVSLRELDFRAEARIERFEEKSGLGTLSDYAAVATPAVDTGQAVDPAMVIDLTAHLGPDGALDWTPPPGRWIVQRFGYSLTGKRNGPATPAATGLEADKLNADHVRAHLTAFFDPLMEAVGENHGDKGLRHAIVDSWEAGQQNWTEAMATEFRRRRGYDITAWLPAMTGRVVGDAERSDRFLWDVRRTIADLLADNHYAVIRDFVHERGLYLYGESMGVDLPTVGDGLQLKGLSDIPTGEFWAQLPGKQPLATHVADIREAASAAHIYGRQMVAAEAFTALDEVPAWSMGPRDLKPVADRFMTEGVNRFVIHTSAHQPFIDRAPGITLRKYGQHFTRHETWGEQASGWMDYLSRSSQMLQQGLPTADLAIFYGEGAPVAAPFAEGLTPEIPRGFDYDYVNAEVLLERMTVEDGRLTLPGGASYRLLVLPERMDRITPALAERLRDLVRDGAAVVAPAPAGTPGLGAESGEQADAAVLAVARDLWGEGPLPASGRLFGKGRIFSGVTAETALAAMNATPDLDWTGDLDIRWKHRRTGTADIYFVSNGSDRAGETTLDFRVDGRTAEIWRAKDGSRTAASWRRADGRTQVPLRLEAGEAVFVVFETSTTEQAFTAPTLRTVALGQVEGPWRIVFQPGRGAPAETIADRLTSWTDSADDGVRYFSGVATYSAAFAAPQTPGPDGRIWLDLGDVREVAEVRVNGKPVGGAWTAPFRVDVTDALSAGENRLEIDVANYWHNRLVGDVQPGATPVAFTTVAAYGSETPLRPSGLLGPVSLSWQGPTQ